MVISSGARRRSSCRLKRPSRASRTGAISSTGSSTSSRSTTTPGQERRTSTQPHRWPPSSRKFSARCSARCSSLRVWSLKHRRPPGLSTTVCIVPLQGTCSTSSVGRPRLALRSLLFDMLSPRKKVVRKQNFTLQQYVNTGNALLPRGGAAVRALFRIIDQLPDCHSKRTGKPEQRPQSRVGCAPLLQALHKIDRDASPAGQFLPREAGLWPQAGERPSKSARLPVPRCHIRILHEV